MKNVFLQIRITAEEKAAAAEVAESRGETLSEMLRAYLARAVKRAKRSQDQGDAA